MEFRIREAGEEDDLRLLQLGLDFWRFNRLASPQQDDDASVMEARAAEWAGIIAHRDSTRRFWVVEDPEGIVLGYGFVRLVRPSPYEDNGTELVGIIDEVFLQEHTRGQGIGTALLRHLIERLRSMGAVHIRLHSYAWNAMANRLYHSLGFEPYAHSWELRSVD